MNRIKLLISGTLLFAATALATNLQSQALTGAKGSRKNNLSNFGTTVS